MDKHGEAHPSIFSRGETGRLNSLSVVLSQEIDRFNKLTKQMKSSLKELQKAIKGLVVMSNELEQMLHSMLDSKVCPFMYH
jgi:dynein heavy chain, axonemal